MQFNKQQPQYAFIQNSDNATSLKSNGNVSQITTPLTADTDKFSGSSSSCTSSTDSGVNISDNETTHTVPPSPSPSPSFSPAPRLQVHSSLQSEEPTTNRVNSFIETQPNRNFSVADKKAINSSGSASAQGLEGVSTGPRGTQRSCTPFGKESKCEQPLKQSVDENNCHTPAPYQSNRNAIKTENVIKYSSHQATVSGGPLATGTTEQQSKTVPLGFNEPPRAVSPAPSSIISSSDTSEDPPSHHQHRNVSPAVSIRSIDSSVIDSDSDSELYDDLEGAHENYVIKKLGTQVSYPPKHPDIPKINSGLEVLNHQIAPNGMALNGQMPASPLAFLASMGDNLGRAHSMGQAPCVSSPPQIAVSSSKDITIGDKHFYEGPVTIQQFLIDSRDKYKESNGKDNPAFDGDDGDKHNNAKDKNPPTTESGNPYVKILQRKKYIISGILAVITLVVLAIVFGIEASSDNKSKNVLGNSEESRKNIPINSTIDTNSGNVDISEEDYKCEEGKLCLMERDIWRAHPQTAKLDRQTLPLHRVVIAHTASEPCDSVQTCADRVRVIQEFHMGSFKWDDIGYNFLVSSDGRVYVGRGWDDVGAFAKGYNYDSVGIAFIGTYVSVKPTEAQLNACRQLIEEGVRLKKLHPNYALYGARQLSATESPGRDNVGGGNILRIVPRDGWLAQPPINPWVPLHLPVDRVIVIPTRTTNCETQAACTYTVRFTQTFNIESQRQDDIIYNFLIGGDGNVYEGRGWDNRASAVKGFNDDSIILAYIGSFNKQQPSDKQMNVTKLLLAEGVRLDKLTADYRIVGANKLDPASTETSADALYESFKDWPHWSDH